MFFKKMIYLMAVASMLGAGTANAGKAEDDLRKLENDWSAALVAADTAALERLIADDFSGTSTDGTPQTKKSIIDNTASGKYKVASSVNGPMKVRVFGNVGIVEGSIEERSTFDGEKFSGTYFFLDVWVNRDGRWVAVASQSVMKAKKK